MTYQELENKIDGIISKISGGAFESDVEEARAWKENVKRAFLTKEIKDHEGIKMIIKRFSSELEDINFVLINAKSDKIADRERDRLLDKKKMYVEFISLFPIAEKEIEQIADTVKENEEFLNLNNE
jgi:hypothetical protein